MHRHDHLRLLTPRRPRSVSALTFQVCWIDVGEATVGPDVGAAVGARGERHRARDQLVAGTQPRREGGGVQRRRARREGDRVRRAARLGERLLEMTDLGPLVSQSPRRTSTTAATSSSSMDLAAVGDRQRRRLAHSAPRHRRRPRQSEAEFGASMMRPCRRRPSPTPRRSRGRSDGKSVLVTGGTGSFGTRSSATSSRITIPTRSASSAATSSSSTSCSEELGDEPSALPDRRRPRPSAPDRGRCAASTWSFTQLR